MDAGISTDQLYKEEDCSGKSLERLDALNKGVVEPPKADKGATLGPITPDPNRENVDFLFDLQSPLTLVSSPRKLVCYDSRPRSSDDPDDIHSTPRTPKEGVFDPFAPGPDEMVLAPQCNKYLGKSRISVARHLNFDSSSNFSLADGNRSHDLGNPLDEEMLLESVYGSLLEAIILKQAEGVLTEISPPELNSDGFQTPTSAPRLNGVAETCPCAPMKPLGKLRNIDLGFCRKLEF